MTRKDEIKIGKAKGRRMLTWVGKKALTRAIACPPYVKAAASIGTVKPTTLGTAAQRSLWR